MKIPQKKILAILLFSFIFLIFGANLVQAAGICQSCTTTAECDSGLECKGEKCRGCPPGQICNPLKACDFQELIDALINFIFWVAIAIAPVMIIIAGFLLVTAAGNPDRVKQAQNIILYTVIGLAIVLLAKGLIAVIRGVIGG